LIVVGARLAKAGFKIDYLERKDDRLFVAAFLGDVRLIDNV
jgi:pantothenate synthetase